MTTVALHGREAAKARIPITAHRWFPAVVGLWFAALFGLSSLAAAPATLEEVVTRLGIDRLVPAATPPLGQTARLLVALGMSSLGEIVGLLLGRYLGSRARTEAVGQPSAMRAGEAEVTVRPRDAHPDAPVRKPLSASEDVAPVDAVLRRRADLAAAPGATEEEPFSAAEELAPPAQAVPPQPEIAIPVEPPRSNAQVAPAIPAGGVASSSLESLGVVQLSERLAIAMRDRRARLAAHSAVAAAAAAAEAAIGEVVEPAPPPAEVAVEPQPDIAEEPAGNISPYLTGGVEVIARRGFRAPLSSDIDADCETAEESDELGAEQNCSSLLSIGRPRRAEQASAAPVAAAADPAEEERALRAALASLQRISGAR